MNELMPFQNLIQELKRAEISLTHDTSTQSQSLLDFAYDTPLIYNDHILLTTYEQYLESVYSSATGNLKTLLRSSNSVDLERVLIESIIQIDELKQEFKNKENDQPLSRVRITMDDCTHFFNADMDAVKKKRCYSSIFNIGTAKN